MVRDANRPGLSNLEQINNRLASGLDAWLAIGYCKTKFHTTFTLQTITGKSLPIRSRAALLIHLKVCQVASTLGVFMPRGLTELWDFFVFVRVNFSFVSVSFAYLWRTGFKRHNWNNFQSLTGDKMKQNSQKNDSVLKVVMIEDVQSVSFSFLCSQSVKDTLSSSLN